MKRKIALIVVLVSVVALAWHIEVTARPDTHRVGQVVQGESHGD